MNVGQVQPDRPGQRQWGLDHTSGHRLGRRSLTEIRLLRVAPLERHEHEGGNYMISIKKKCLKLKEGTYRTSGMSVPCLSDGGASYILQRKATAGLLPAFPRLWRKVKGTTPRQEEQAG